MRYDVATIEDDGYFSFELHVLEWPRFRFKWYTGYPGKVAGYKLCKDRIDRTRLRSVDIKIGYKWHRIISKGRVI